MIKIYIYFLKQNQIDALENNKSDNWFFENLQINNFNKKRKYLNNLEFHKNKKKIKSIYLY